MSSLNDTMDKPGSGFESLEFKEFSWKDDEGGYKDISAAHFDMLNTYLKTLFPEITTIEERTPYLVIWCENAVPKIIEAAIHDCRLAGRLARRWRR